MDSSEEASSSPQSDLNSADLASQGSDPSFPRDHLQAYRTVLAGENALWMFFQVLLHEHRKALLYQLCGATQEDESEDEHETALSGPPPVIPFFNVNRPLLAGTYLTPLYIAAAFSTREIIMDLICLGAFVTEDAIWSAVSHGKEESAYELLTVAAIQFVDREQVFQEMDREYYESILESNSKRGSEYKEPDRRRWLFMQHMVRVPFLRENEKRWFLERLREEGGRLFWTESELYLRHFHRENYSHVGGVYVGAYEESSEAGDDVDAISSDDIFEDMRDQMEPMGVVGR